VAREPVQERPILPIQVPGGDNVDMVLILQKMFHEIGISINDDLVVVTDWVATVSTATHAMIETDRFVMVDAPNFPIAVTLPLASNCEPHLYCVKKIDSSGNAVTVNRAGSDLIDGATSKTLNSQYDLLLLVTDRASSWHCLRQGAP